MVQSSIDLAHELGAGFVVVHCGSIEPDPDYEREMRDLFNQGLKNSEAYLAIKEKLVQYRSLNAPGCFESVKKSLLELIPFARNKSIRLALENRYHYLDFPTLAEMDELLALGDAKWLGMTFDTGHAQAMDKLGFFPLNDWLEKYSGRIINVHLHDVNGVDDHRAPGLGEVDFSSIARYIPRDAQRTLEVLASNTYEQIRKGLDLLEQTGILLS
jgi:sugar phosphate isomerase/epimerase